MKTDWVAEVFSAMRDCGENISIVYGQKPASSAQEEPMWFELPHNRYDGISGLATLLRQQGCRVEQLPVLRGDRFTWLRALRGLFAVLPALQIRQRQWRQFDGARKVGFLPVRERVAWELFTEDQTQRIAHCAKAAGVTVNTYLLFHLDALVCCHLALSRSGNRWMVPVNLRGAVKRADEAAPHMAFLGVDVDRNGSLTELQARISRLKQRAYHWGAWIILHAGKLIGAEGMRRDVHNREQKNHGWTGIFSNLGVWEVPGGGHWIFGPAISRVHPVGAGCITLNGRMALTLQLHDAFGVGLRTAHGLLQYWKHACLQEPARPQSATGPVAVQPAAMRAVG
jgi:hypothetical protein